MFVKICYSKGHFDLGYFDQYTFCKVEDTATDEEIVKICLQITKKYCESCGVNIKQEEKWLGKKWKYGCGWRKADQDEVEENNCIDYTKKVLN